MTRWTDIRAVTLAALAAMLAAALTLAAPAAVAKKGGGTVRITKQANLPIPDETPPFGDGVDGVANSTIEVGKKFKGQRIRDVNVTVQTQGTANKSSPPSPMGFSGPVEAIDVAAILRAPNGAHTILFTNLIPPLASTTPVTLASFPSLGPLTVDDEARLAIGSFNPHSAVELYAPFAGAARPEEGGALSVMDNGPVRGTWTLTVLDTLNTGTSTLASWGLEVRAGKPYRTK